MEITYLDTADRSLRYEMKGLVVVALVTRPMHAGSAVIFQRRTA